MNEQTKLTARQKYADIIDLPRPVSRRRRMPRGDRAKMFAPFAPLKPNARQNPSENRDLR